MSTRKTKLLVLLATIAFAMACVPAIATPFPTADPNEINTIIASTANAASTQTSAAMPTLTFTPTITPTRPTDTPEPSATSTVIFILSSPTKVVVPTFTPISSSGGGGNSGGGSSSGGSSSSANFACQVISVTPANGTNFKARADFDTTWRVKNTGQKTWDRNSVDFVYDSGAKINKVSGYDLSNNVKVGEQIDLSVDMEAPKNSGSYTTSWTLRVGNTDFCKMSLTINVK